uniref:hypothetical protein n=1 Tax=Nocardia cyriacigeorgica TaxID=135487 RepID=UPI002457DEEA
RITFDAVADTVELHEFAVTELDSALHRLDPAEGVLARCLSFNITTPATGLFWQFGEDDRCVRTQLVVDGMGAGVEIVGEQVDHDRPGCLGHR